MEDAVADLFPELIVDSLHRVTYRARQVSLQAGRRVDPGQCPFEPGSLSLARGPWLQPVEEGLQGEIHVPERVEQVIGCL
jgi:hypothetical protein